jgi:hypothetical protein
MGASGVKNIEEYLRRLELDNPPSNPLQATLNALQEALRTKRSPERSKRARVYRPL